MSRVSAFRFLDKCRSSAEFREAAYEAEGAQAFRAWMAAEGYLFSDDELEDCIRSLRLRAVDEEEANELQDLGAWYKMMLSGETAPACADCSACSGKCQ